MMRKDRAILLMVFALVAFSVGVNARTAPADPYQQSLISLQNKVPLSYNESVRKTIESYKSQKKRFSEMLGLSKYYFPIYEKAFREHNIPDELKYISVIESSLNPNAVSRMGATGSWQFMYEIGKIYGLTINESIDERKDPVLASHAAAKYLLDSYAMYGDWLLAIASYNCGRNNIKWATEKAGGAKDYWSIRKYLPVETQNYIPAYIATVYIMNNYTKHGIYPAQPFFNIETEVLTIKTPGSLEDIARQANISVNDLRNLNPSYLNLMVNASPESPRNLVIPVLPTHSYNAVCKILGLPGRPMASEVVAQIPVARVFYYIMYRVQDGDTLTSITGKFTGAIESDIKTENNLGNSALTPGTVLQIKLEKV